MRKILTAFAVFAGFSMVAGAAQAAESAAQGSAPAPAPSGGSIEQLVRQVNIPYQQFTLPNGLRVIVHEDHKAPIVAVSVWYSSRLEGRAARAAPASPICSSI